MPNPVKDLRIKATPEQVADAVVKGGAGRRPGFPLLG